MLTNNELLKPLAKVDLCAEMWGEYLGAIARAVVDQYASELYASREDGNVIAAIREGFCKAFGG